MIEIKWHDIDPDTGRPTGPILYVGRAVAL